MLKGMNQEANHQKTSRNDWVFLVSILGAVLLGTLIAPHVFNGLLSLGRTHEGWSGLRNLEFDSVTGRCVLVCLVLSLIPALKVTGMYTPSALGFARVDQGRTLWFRGLIMGVVSLLVVVLIGWASGAYFLHVDDKIKDVGKVLSIIVGAVLIGFLEEALFRGLLFGSIRKSSGFWMAALISSLLFMAVHFAKPEPEVTPVYGDWKSGLEMFKHMFYTGHHISHYFPFMLTLFLMGVVLCLVYERQGSILMAVGLHTGWVIVIRLSGYYFNRDSNELPLLFGEGELVSKTYLTLIVSIGFLLYFWRSGKKA